MIWPWVGREKLIEAEKCVAVLEAEYRALRDEMTRIIKNAGASAGRYAGEKLDEQIRHREVEAELREQIQDLAEKLSTLALQGATPVVHKFEKKPEPPRPYSPDLQAFFDAIDFPQARELVEEDIERYRAQGLDDEQILQNVSEALDD